MTNLFDLFREQAGVDFNPNYGMSGDMKKTQYKLELIGSPYDAETLKCIITAAEQGMEMECYSMAANKDAKITQLLDSLSSIYITPFLKEADFITYGADAITSFIDARGLGYPLTPRNAALAAIQNYWCDIADNNVAPKIAVIVEEVFEKKLIDPAHIPNMQCINQYLSELELYLNALDEQLQTNKYIVCDKYTWADLHWTANLHLCELAGCNSMITERANINRWFKRIKTRKSQCGQDIVAYELLPKLDDLISGKLNNVEISDY